jgi:glucose/arabinose dehydrogenase
LAIFNLLALLLAFSASSAAFALDMETYYKVEDIAAPAGVVPETQGLSTLPDGRIVAAFAHGEVGIYNPSTKQWSIFAEGLHCPMGVLAVSDREIYVVQRPELTKLVDTDGDGKADQYTTICDAWGESGNYHEFANGLIRDKDGNFYVALGNGSNGGPARMEVRGKYSANGDTDKSHFSCVPYRGWVIRVSPTGEVTPIAPGFRQPNGLGFDAAGRLLVSDNQGDWVGTSKLHHVQPGKFYGHPPSLVWKPGFENKPPRDLGVDELDRMRTEGVVLFPHAIMANSPGQPLTDTTAGKFGPFAGQVFVTEFNIPRLMRVMLEDVAGQTQGAVTTFFDGPPLHSANIRMTFAPDGSLWTCSSERRNGWPGATGIQRISWTGKTPLDISEMHLTKTGFEMVTTKPLNPATITADTAWKARRYYYQYHESYGSPQVDVHDVKVTNVNVSQDRKRFTFDVDTIEPGFIYEFSLSGVKAEDGEPLLNTLIAYTLNRTLDGKAPSIPRPTPTGKTLGSGKDKPAAQKTKKTVE